MPRTSRACRAGRRPRPAAWAVANRRHRLARLREVTDQLYGPLIHPQLVGIADPAGQQQRVKIIRIDLVDRQVGGDAAARFVVDGGHDFLARRRRQRHPGSPFEKYLARAEQLAFLEAVGGHDQDVGIGNCRHLFQPPRGTSASARLYAPNR